MLKRSHERALVERTRGIDWRSTSGAINCAADDGWERLFEDPIELVDGIEFAALREHGRLAVERNGPGLSKAEAISNARPGEPWGLVAGEPVSIVLRANSSKRI